MELEHTERLYNLNVQCENSLAGVLFSIHSYSTLTELLVSCILCVGVGVGVFVCTAIFSLFSLYLFDGRIFRVASIRWSPCCR